jgi:excisionase family DNA binding protein
MPFRGLGTGKVAQITGVHPNTIRLYQQWGYLSPVARTPSGYRLYTPLHIEQVKLVRLVYGGIWPGRIIRQAGAAIIHAAAVEDFSLASGLALKHLEVIHGEQAQAEAAVQVLQHWAAAPSAPVQAQPLRIGEAAGLLNVSVDMLRNWERNGLLSVPRVPGNRYRLYGENEIARLRVIRLLLKSGYSMMAVLRMLVQLDRGETADLRAALDTPGPDEDVFMAADRWLTALADVEKRGRAILSLVEQLP